MLTFTDVASMGENGRAKTMFDFGERMTLRLNYKTNGRVLNARISASASIRDDGPSARLLNYSTELDIPSSKAEARSNCARRRSSWCPTFTSPTSWSATGMAA